MKSKIKNPATISGLQNKIGCFSAVLVAGFLAFAMPALAIQYDRTPAGSPAISPFHFYYEYNVYEDIGCGAYSYWGFVIKDSSDLVYTSNVSRLYAYSLFDWYDVSLPAGNYNSVEIGCSTDGTSLDHIGILLEGAFVVAGLPVVSSGWFPADFLTSVNYHVNDFINDGAPAVILVIGLALAVWIINWLISFFIRRKK